MLTWKCDTVFTSGKIVLTTLSSIKVACGIVIIYGILVGVDGRLIGIWVDIGLVGNLWGRFVGYHRCWGRLVGYYRGGLISHYWGRLISNNWCRLADNDRGRLVNNDWGGDHSFDNGSNWGRHNKFLSGSGSSGSGASSGTESLDEASSNGILEVSTSEHSHIVCWLLELEQDGQISGRSCSDSCDDNSNETGLKINIFHQFSV